MNLKIYCKKEKAPMCKLKLTENGFGHPMLTSIVLAIKTHIKNQIIKPIAATSLELNCLSLFNKFINDCAYNLLHILTAFSDEFVPIWRTHFPVSSAATLRTTWFSSPT